MLKEPLMKQLLLLLLSLPLCALVVTQKIEEGTLTQQQTFNATVSFNEKARLASESDGIITDIYFDEGDYVKRGSPLLQIDSQILNAKIEATEASIEEVKFSLEKVKLDFKRYETLLKQESVSRQQYDEFYFQKKQLEQKLLSLESSLKAQHIERSKKKLRAPFNGYISQRNVQIGEWVKEGSQVALLVNPDKVDILVHLPSGYLPSIFNNKTPMVLIGDKTYPAKLIGPLLSGDEKTRTFPLKLRLLPTEDRFFEGMQARISLQKSTQQNVLLLSRDAIIKRFGKDVVFIVKENKAAMIPVQIIGFEGNKVAVSSSELQIGDDVIIKGNERIRPDQEISQ